jgi:hypothetical protein
MQTLRRTKHLARLVLAWFVCALGVAVASPLIQTQEFTLVCSDVGMVKLQAVSDDGNALRIGHTLDCPLCLQLLAPPVPPLLQAAHGAAPIALAQGIAKPLAPSERTTLFFARGPPTFALL